MLRISRSLTTPVLLIVALMLSSCVGAAVQSAFVPQEHSATYASEAAISSPAQLLYAQGTNHVFTTSSSNQPIPGMSLTLPAATTTSHHALVTFSAPTTEPQTGCFFTIYAGATATLGSGSAISRDMQTVFPMNIVIRLPLTTAKQTITVDWNAGGQTCQMNFFYSLSAIITN